MGGGIDLLGSMVFRKTFTKKRIRKGWSFKLIAVAFGVAFKKLQWLLLGAVTVSGVFGGALGQIALILGWNQILKGKRIEARYLMLGGLIGILICDYSLYIIAYWFLMWSFMELFFLKMPKQKNIKVVTTLSAVLYPALLLLGKRVAFPIVTYLIYMLLTAVLQVCFYKCQNILGSYDRVWKADEVAIVLISVILICTSLNNEALYGIQLDRILFFLTVFASGVLGGPLWGVVAGTLVALFGGLSKVGHYLIILGAFSGSIAMSRGFTPLIALGSLFLIFIDSRFYAVKEELILANLALPLLIKNTRLLKFSIPVSVPKDKTESKAIELKARIDKFSETLQELAKIFGAIPQTLENDNENAIPLLVEDIALKACTKCDRQKNCWQTNFYTTYGNVLDILIELENKPPSEIVLENTKIWCARPKELIDTAVSLWKMRGLDIVWQRRLIESKSVVAKQLNGLAGLVSDLGCQLDLLEKDKHCTDISGFELKRKGIDFSSLECARFEHGIAVTVSVPRKHGLCRDKEVAKVISGVLGEEYIVEEHICRIDTCDLSLVPKSIYEADVFIKRKPANGYAICGDSCAAVSLKRNKHLMILSDGMGIGPEAALQSSTVVSFVERFISLGVAEEETLKLVNSVSFLSAENETFATVDLVLVDKYTGEVRLSKLGSASSFVKRGKRVEVVSGNTLPVGMLSSIEITEKRCYFRPQDLLVVVSDGVIIEGQRIHKDPKWLERLLSDCDGSAGDVGETIFSMLPQKGNDDLTVMVLQIVLS